MAGKNKTSASRRVCQLDNQIQRSHDRSSPATWTSAAAAEQTLRQSTVLFAYRPAVSPTKQVCGPLPRATRGSGA